MFSTKIGTHVSFPLDGLDLQPFLGKDSAAQTTTYDLLSVICHHGTASSEFARRREHMIGMRSGGTAPRNGGAVVHLTHISEGAVSELLFLLVATPPGGHYIAYCRNDLNNLWYEFDDQSVTEVSESCVQNAEAYVLFYK